MKNYLSKTLATVALLFMAVSSFAATHVYFNVSEFGATPIVSRQITIQPTTPFVGNIVFLPLTDASGVTWYSNANAGVYNGVIKAPPGTINFQFYVSSTNLGVIDAVTNTSISGVQTYPAGASAWSILASDARYARSSNSLSAATLSGGSGITVYNGAGAVLGSGTRIEVTNLFNLTNGLIDASVATNISAYQAKIATNGLTPVTLVDGVGTTVASPSAGVYQVNVTGGGGAATNVIDVAAGANVTIVTNALLRTISVPGANPAALTNYESRKVYLSNGADITNLNNSFRVMSANGVVQFWQPINETGVRFTKATGDGSGITNIPFSSIVGLNSVTNLDFSTNIAAPDWVEGRVFYDVATHTLCYYNDQSAVTVNIGQEQHVRVVNKTASTIVNGAAVTISGAQGNRPKVILAQATTNTASSGYEIIGVATENILPNAEGLVTTLGVVNGVDTRSYNAGATLYCSTNSGVLTTNKYSSDISQIVVGIALNSTADGALFISPKNPTHKDDVTSLLTALTYLTNAPAYSNSYNGTFVGNGAGITNIPLNTSTLYVAPWGNNATAQRGNILKPWAILYDYDGTNRSGACAVATNGDTIVLMGTNYVGQAQLVTGQTLEGIGNAALLFTNRMSFTNNTLNCRGSQNPSWPWIACFGSNITVRNLYLNARDNSNDGTGSGINFNSLFQSAAPPILGTLGPQIHNDTTQNKLYYGNSTNVSQYPYTSWTLFGTTNQPDRVIIDNCTLVGNVDVFYLNWTQQPTTFYNALGTYEQIDNITLNCTLPSPGNEAAFWSCPDVQAVTWTTNVFPATAQPRFTVKDSTLISYWDHTFINGCIYEAVNVSAYSLGYTNVASANNYAQGPVLSGASMLFSDVGGKYFYNAYTTNFVNTHGIKSTGGKVVLSGTTFYMSNGAPVVKLSNLGNISGNYYDGLTGAFHQLGSTNLFFDIANVGGPLYPLDSGNRSSSNIFAASLTGGIIGNGLGLTNLPRTGITGLESALSYLTNNSGGGSASGAWNTNGNSGLPTGSFVGTTDNTSLQLRSSNTTLVQINGYSNTVVLGKDNTITGWQPHSTIGGGRGNVINGRTNSVFSGFLGHNVIAGGQTNSINESSSTLVGRNFVGGGYLNSIQDGGANAVVLVGGGQNTNAGAYSYLGGGIYNFIQNQNTFSNGIGAALSGGSANTVSGDYGTISGGRSNSITGIYATVPGGLLNTASGSNSLAAGFNASAANLGAFVWSDSSGGNFASTNNNSFNVRAAGGAKFYTSGGGLWVDGARITNSAIGKSIAVTNIDWTTPTSDNLILYTSGNDDALHWAQGNIVAESGSMVAASFIGNAVVPSFIGNGLGLTNIAASNIVSGGQLGMGVVAAGISNIAGPFLTTNTFSRYYSWDGGALTNVTAASMTNGVVSGLLVYSGTTNYAASTWTNTATGNSVTITNGTMTLISNGVANVTITPSGTNIIRTPMEIGTSVGRVFMWSFGNAGYIASVPANGPSSAGGRIRLPNDFPNTISFQRGSDGAFSTDVDCSTGNWTYSGNLTGASSTANFNNIIARTTVTATNGFAMPTVTGGTTALTTQPAFIVTSSSQTITLPGATTNIGRLILIKNRNVTTTTVNTVSSQTIDGASTFSLPNAYSGRWFISDGSNWLTDGDGL